MRTYPTARLGIHSIGRLAPFGRGEIFRSPAAPGPGHRLAQASAAPTDPDNRLLDLTVGQILGRRSVATAYWNPLLSGMQMLPTVPKNWPNVTQAELDAFDAFAPGIQASGGTGWTNLSAATGLPVPTLKTLMQVSLDPTSKELGDADLIDRYFGEQPPAQTSMTWPDPNDPGPWLLNLCTKGEFDPNCPLPGRKGDTWSPGQPCFQRHVQGMDLGPKQSGAGDVPLNDFWCPPWSRGSKTGPMAMAIRSEYGHQDHWKGGWPVPPSPKAVFWGVTLGEPWSTVKPWLPNAERADKILLDFPFPAPFGEYIFTWTRFAVPELRAWIRLPVRLSEESIRAFITFTVLAHYEEMAVALDAYLKKRAKRFAQNQLIKTIAVIAISVIGLAAGIAVAAGAATALIQAKTEMDKIDFEAEMTKVADAFESTDPAFAQEVRNAKDWAQKVAAGGAAALESGAGSGLLTIGLAAGSAAAIGITIALLLGGGK